MFFSVNFELFCLIFHKVVTLFLQADSDFSECDRGFKMAKVKVTPKKPKKKSAAVAQKVKDQNFKTLALYERKSFISVLSKACDECHTKPVPKNGFSWACIAMINDDRTLNPMGTYVVRYENLHSEREVLYTDEFGKKVKNAFPISVVFYFLGL